MRQRAPLLFAIADAAAHIARAIGTDEMASAKSAPHIDVRLPVRQWARLEDEMATIGRDEFENITNGIEIHADGMLKKISLFGFATVWCKTGDQKTGFDFRTMIKGERNAAKK